MKKKNNIITLPKKEENIKYTFNYNINNVPKIKTLKNDYDTIRNIVINNDENSINKIHMKKENIINKNIINFQIV